MRASGGFGKQPGDIASHLQFDGAHSDRADHLFVALPAGGSEQSRRESVASLIQSLDRIATSNNLTRDDPTSSGALLRLDYRSGGVITNSVHIVAPVARAASSASSRQGEKNGAARLAIILDDLGNDRAAADAIFALHYPLTISVLPNHAHSVEIAEEAHRRGYEVMLHLPMQSVGNETPEAHELHPGMPAGDIPALFEQMMQSIPNATIEYLADVSFSRHTLHISLPRDSRSVHDRKVVAACAAAVRGALPASSLDPLSHEHARYQISITATYRSRS